MNGLDKVIAQAIRLARDNALDAAIDICEQFAMVGGSPANCVRAIRDLKEMLPRPPSEGN